jgi:hypothetical protein
MPALLQEPATTTPDAPVVLSSQDTNLDIKVTTPPPFLLLLNGFQGVGKLTLARELSVNLSSLPNSPPHRLLDNHLLIDPASAIEPTRSPAHYLLRKSFRDIAFSALKSLPSPLIILMTACLSETEDNIAQFYEYMGIARERGCGMVVVNVVCGEEENKMRLCSEERVCKLGNGKGKLIDGKILERLRREYRLLDLERLECDNGEGRVRLFRFEVETTEMSVQEATENIWGLLRGCLDF